MKTALTFRLFAALLLVLLWLAGLGVRPAYAASYTVNSLADNTTAGDGACTLREAIESANNAGNNDCGTNSSADDTITFSVGGTIVLSPTLGTLPAIVSGQGALTIDGGGNITISGGGSVRVMYVNTGANLTLQNLTIANGKASSGSSGGGIWNGGTLTVTNCIFSNNSASFVGGGILNASSGTLNVTNSTFLNNNAETSGGGGGGGIYNSGGTLNVTNSTFANNSAPSGGGIRSDGSSGMLNVTNSTFANNSASGSGGGIYHESGTLTVTNSTFSGNSATSGGGIRIFSGSATLRNTLIANSPSGGDCVNSSSGTASGNNNLIKDSSNACGLTHNVNGNLIGQDPQLGALTGNPAYYSLLPTSPAIDKGDNATCAAHPVNNQSQNGVARPQDGDNNGSIVCDIGAYERPLYKLHLPLILR